MIDLGALILSGLRVVVVLRRELSGIVRLFLLLQVFELHHPNAAVHEQDVHAVFVGNRLHDLRVIVERLDRCRISLPIGRHVGVAGVGRHEQVFVRGVFDGRKSSAEAVTAGEQILVDRVANWEVGARIGALVEGILEKLLRGVVAAEAGRRHARIFAVVLDRDAIAGADIRHGLFVFLHVDHEARVELTHVVCLLGELALALHHPGHREDDAREDADDGDDGEEFDQREADQTLACGLDFHSAVWSWSCGLVFLVETTSCKRRGIGQVELLLDK